MNFLEAIKSTHNGFKVKRKNWTRYGSRFTEVICVCNESESNGMACATTYIVMILEKFPGNEELEEHYPIGIDDALAEDWIVKKV